MKVLMLLGMLGAVSSAQEKVEKVKTTIAPVTKDSGEKIEVPHQIPNLEWDPKGIRLVRRELGAEQKFAVLMKGAISKHKVESFTYQVDDRVAIPIKLKNNQFDLDIPLEKSPAIIRLWLEVTEGRGVRLYSDEVRIRSDIVPGAAEEKQINY
jgi:hypothetical protein